MTKNDKLIAYKGFDKNLCCKEMQYEVGKTYKHRGKLVSCISGFHACFYPLDVFQYYAPGVSRYCEVEISGKTIEDDDKVCCERIKILRELTLEYLVEIAVWRRKEENREHTQEERSISSATGHYSASSTTGDYSASVSAEYGAASTSTGDYSASVAMGNCSASSATGRWSASTTTGDDSASLTTGHYSDSSATGQHSRASVGGTNSVAYASGYRCKAKASEGSWIALVERNKKGEILNMRCGKAGVDIKPDTFYKLVDGEFVKE